MRGVAAPTFAAALAIVLVGCGAGSHAAAPAVTKTIIVTSPATSASSPAARRSASATTNERLFADALAESIPAIPAKVVSGTLMGAYARFQHAYAAALGAVGQPASSESITPITGGFKVCYPAAGSYGPYCEYFTKFITNQAGQITGVSVNGQPVAGRIATAPDATSGGLTISSVIAYRLTKQNVVMVAFKLTDSNYRPQASSPSLLASLNGASDAVSQDALPAFLALGDNLYAAAGFDITQTTGQFCLQPNGQSASLPCTTLSKV
jgi:hypothetical protein